MIASLTCLATLALAATASADEVLWDNGPLLTHSGSGANGADVSVRGPGSAQLGFVFNGDPWRRADSFTLSETQTITRMTFYGYEIDSSKSSSIVGLTVRIWDGDPRDGSSNVIWGNTTTNLLHTSKWSGAYRTLGDDLINQKRPIMELQALVEITLDAGTYWIDFATTGSLLSQPRVPPVSDPDEHVSGDSLVFDGSSWSKTIDVGVNKGVKLPFRLEALPVADDNDACANAYVMSPGTTVAGNNNGATMDLREHMASCSAEPNETSVWFSFSAPEDGTAIFSTSGSEMDAVLSLLSTCPQGPEAEIACSVNHSPIMLDMAEGEMVIIRIAGRDNAEGSFFLTTEFEPRSACCLSNSCIETTMLTCAQFAGVFKPGLSCADEPHCNDACERAIDLEGDLRTGISMQLTNVHSEPDGMHQNASCLSESEDAEAAGMNAVWYKFIAAADGVADISAVDCAAELMVYEGACPSNGGVLVGCIAYDPDHPELLVQLVGMPVLAGHAFYIRVAHAGSGLNTMLNVNLTLTVDVPCLGDADGNEIVDVQDLLIVIGNWGSSGPAGDLNSDGLVDVDDLLQVIWNWGQVCPIE